MMSRPTKEYIVGIEVHGDPEHVIDETSVDADTQEEALEIAKDLTDEWYPGQNVFLKVTRESPIDFPAIVEVITESVDPVIDVHIRGPPESMGHVEKKLGRRLCYPVNPSRLPRKIARRLQPGDAAVKCRVKRSRAEEVERIAKESADAFDFRFKVTKRGDRDA